MNTPTSESKSSMTEVRVAKVVKAEYERVSKATVLLSFRDHKTGLSARVAIWPDGSSELIGNPSLIDYLCDQVPEFRGMFPIESETLPAETKSYRRLWDAEGNARFTERGANGFVSSKKL